jgi:hypothetical protein
MGEGEPGVGPSTLKGNLMAIERGGQVASPFFNCLYIKVLIKSPLTPLY